MPNLPLTKESVEQFRGFVAEWKGVDLTHEEAADAASEFLREIWTAASVSADLESRGETFTRDGYDARAEELFPGYAARELRHFPKAHAEGEELVVEEVGGENAP